MADSKISALPASTTPLAGTEVLPIVQSSTTKQVSVANLTAGRAISATQLTLTTGNLIVASGQGIDFSATPGTGTSELLADYEEGTWTGTLTAATPPTDELDQLPPPSSSSAAPLPTSTAIDNPPPTPPLQPKRPAPASDHDTAAISRPRPLRRRCPQPRPTQPPHHAATTPPHPHRHPSPRAPGPSPNPTAHPPLPAPGPLPPPCRTRSPQSQLRPEFQPPENNESKHPQLNVRPRPPRRQPPTGNLQQPTTGLGAV